MYDLWEVETGNSQVMREFSHRIRWMALPYKSMSLRRNYYRQIQILSALFSPMIDEEVSESMSRMCFPSCPERRDKFEEHKTELRTIRRLNLVLWHVFDKFVRSTDKQTIFFSKMPAESCYVTTWRSAMSSPPLCPANTSTISSLSNPNSESDWLGRSQRTARTEKQRQGELKKREKNRK